MDFNSKNILRNNIWMSLSENRQIRGNGSCYGRIPNFIGAEIAANNLEKTIEWQRSNTIFCSPDSAQKEVRENALKSNKVLIMVTPKIKHGYLHLDPENFKGREKLAATIKGAFKYGLPVLKFTEIDLVVEGSVAVDFAGNRLGKGGGYGDREIEQLIQSKAINHNTPIVSTIHDVQMVDQVPTQPHDQKISMAVTPNSVIRMKEIKILW